ncbi:MAG: hypothetical protein AAGG75_17120 [Bacteroidota bacterium]
MNHFSSQLAFVGLVFLLLFSGCQKFNDLSSLETPDLDAEFAVPLFSTQTSIQDLLESFDEETFITVMDDGQIVLNYKGDVIARNSFELFDVLTTFDGIPLPIFDTLTALPFELPNEVDIEYAILKTGTLSWFWESQHEEDVTFRFFIPSVLDDNGEMFEIIENATYTAGEPVRGGRIGFNLAGYRVEPEQDSLYVGYELIRENGMRDTATNVFMLISNFTTSYVEGYLGNDIYELERDTIEIEFFENWTRGEVYFAEPKVLVTVENSFGFPVRSKTNLMNVITVNGDLLPLRSEFVDNGIDIDYPRLNQVGETVTTFFTFDKNNSNLDSILGAGPVALDYDLDALPNPDGNTSIIGFMTDTSRFRVQLEVELPIYGTTSGFAARDTLQISFNDYDDVDRAEFKLVAENAMPLAAGIQLHFADANNQVLDSLFIEEQIVIEAAPVDSDGNANDIAKKETFIAFDNTRFEKIKTASQVFLTVAFSTYNNAQIPVRVLSDQQVQIRMGMKVGLN